MGKQLSAGTGGLGRGFSRELAHQRHLMQQDYNSRRDNSSAQCSRSRHKAIAELMQEDVSGVK